MEDGKNRRGCFISTCVGLFLIVLAILLAGGVGVIVYFAVDGRDVVCKCQSRSDVGSISLSAIKDRCEKIVESGDYQVCGKCPTNATSITTDAPFTSSTGDTPTIRPKVKDVRLPRSIVPSHYNVRLQPMIYTGDSQNFTFKGYVSIRVKCVESTDNITLHAKTLKINTDTLRLTGVDLVASRDPTILGTEEDDDRQFFIVKLGTNLQKDREYVLSMNFTSPMGTGTGLYLTSYQHNNQTVYMVASQFEPTAARTAFPCFDEPALKATFNITLARKADLLSISNTPIIDSSEKWTEDGIPFVGDRYQQTPRMSTYLLAFIVCAYGYTSKTTENGVQFRAFARPEVTDSTWYALNTGVSVLPYYEQYYETKYPLPKQDMIAIGPGQGGMENWGLITYGEASMLYTDGVTTAENKEHVSIVVSHELAHMWFGDLVSPYWWDDLWLNEGFANFVENMGVDFVHPDWKMWDKFVVNSVHDALRTDGKATSHPVYVPVSNPDEIQSIFDIITYNKGGSIVRMMRHFLGEETFRRGLVKYLQRHKYDVATHNDLWKALEDQAREDGKDLKVKEVMDTWTLQMNYPVVTVTRDFNDMNMVHMTQSRFLVSRNVPDPGKYTSPYGYKWTIPITITSSRNPNFIQNSTDVFWMKKEEASTRFNVGEANLPDINDKNGWILCNTEQHGFYRVNYQLGNWKALTKQLKTNHSVISAINRAQIISDTWNLIKSGELNVETALDAVNYLEREKDYVPWKAANTELGYVTGMLSLTPAFGLYEKFMLEKSTGPFNMYWLDNTRSTHIETQTRSQVAMVACEFGNAYCLRESSRQFKSWMGNKNNNMIDLNLRSIIYCTAVRQGGWDEWNFALDMLKQTTITAERANLLRALSCSTKQWILNSLLYLVLEESSPFHGFEAVTVIRSVGTSPHGRVLAWQFYRENFDKINDDFSGISLVTDLTSTFNTEGQMNEVSNMKEMSKNKGAQYPSLDRALETIRANSDWMAKHYKPLQAWLEAKYNTNIPG